MMTLWYRRLGCNLENLTPIRNAVWENESLPLCDDRQPAVFDRPDYRCDRPAGHPGRHIYISYGMVCAAWPGDHEPTLGDLL